MNRVCVIGSPVSHSRSPLIHNFWLAQHGIEGRYEKCDVLPEDLPDFLKKIRDGEFAGCNVTIPHKESVHPLLDELTPYARRIGAINTIWRENETLLGDNTDAPGFMAHLDAAFPKWEKNTRNIVILGSGGATRAIACAMLERNVPMLVIACRNPKKAQKIIDDLCQDIETATQFRHCSLESLPDACDLLINTTSCGMSGGQAPLTLDLSRIMRPGGCVADVVYNPLKTPLISDALRKNFAVLDGLGMLLNQAALSFQRWYGVMPAVTDELRTLVENDLTH